MTWVCSVIPIRFCIYIIKNRVDCIFWLVQSLIIFRINVTKMKNHQSNILPWSLRDWSLRIGLRFFEILLTRGRESRREVLRGMNFNVSEVQITINFPTLGHWVYAKIFREIFQTYLSLHWKLEFNLDTLSWHWQPTIGKWAGVTISVYNFNKFEINAKGTITLALTYMLIWTQC